MNKEVEDTNGYRNIFGIYLQNLFSLSLDPVSLTQVLEESGKILFFYIDNGVSFFTHRK